MKVKKCETRLHCHLAISLHISSAWSRGDAFFVVAVRIDGIKSRR